jgi:hypothetical protein
MHTIEFATKDDIPVLTDFFARVYRPDHITTDSEYLAWQYKKAPGNIHAPKYSNLLFKKDSVIIGHLGLIPYVFCSASGRKLTGAYLASLIVDESLRNYGAGAMLVREAEKYFDILYTSRANELAQPALRYSNWSKELFMTRWIYDCTKNDTEVFDTNNSHIIEIHKFGKEWDDSWKNLHGSYGITINRTSSYCNWRFIDNFKVSYNIFGYKDGLFEGYIVLRLEEGDEYRACRIVDFIVSEKSALPLLQKAIQFGFTKKVHFLDFFSFPKIFASVLEEAGFYIYDSNINEDPPMFILPVSRKRLTTNFFYKIVKDSSIDLLPDNCYITKADGDRDRAY